MSADFSGGCRCGKVRYRFTAYDDAGYCHCRECQRASGAPVVAWAHVRSEHMRVFGDVARADAASGGTRWFCGACGSPLYFRDDEDTYFAVNLASLDDPGAVPPTVHMCLEEQVDWLAMGDLLPAFEGSEIPEPGSRDVLRGPADPTVTAGARISLRPIDRENLREVLLLAVKGSQRRLVSTNAVSLAQGLMAGDAWLRAVYADETPVGFVMLYSVDHEIGDLEATGDPYVWRFMIDERYQALGFGGRAMAAVIEHARTWQRPALWLSCVTGAGSPQGFYAKLGFVDTGVRDEDGELYMRLLL